MTSSYDLGKKGEIWACNYLINKGYHILDQNWRSGKKELDIIAIYNGMLIIAEVKTRSTNYFGRPSDFVSRNKKRLLMEAANDYLDKYNINYEIRFDILEINFNKKKIVNHIENAFLPHEI